MKCYDGKIKNIYLIMWSILLIVLVTVFKILMYNYLPHYLMPYRVNILNSYIEDVNNGFFPRIADSNNIDHALGIYILGAYLGHILAVDGSVLFEVLIQIVFGITVIVFPFLIQKLYNNFVISFISPVLVCVFFVRYFVLASHDVYVAIGISMVVLSMPLIRILDNCKSNKNRMVLYLILILIVSFSNIAREHTSLGLFLIVGYYIICDIFSSRKNGNFMETIKYVLLLLLMLIAYNMCSTFIPNIMLKLNGQEQWLTESTAWHNIYIGFGFFDNPYGLYYSDDCAYDIVCGINPEIFYGSNEYFAACRSLVMELLKSDFWFCIKSFICKGVYILVSICGVVFINIPVLLLFIFSLWKNRMSIKIDIKYLLMFILMFLVGLIPSILTAPVIAYSITSYATLNIFIMIYFIEAFSVDSTRWIKNLMGKA